MIKAKDEEEKRKHLYRLRDVYMRNQSMLADQHDLKSQINEQLSEVENPEEYKVKDLFEGNTFGP